MSLGEQLLQDRDVFERPPRRRATRIVYAPPTVTTRSEVLRMYDRGVSIATLAQHFGLSWPSVRAMVGETR